ncbi:P-loop containing nucleoside triphosphate hydrolase protein [Pelagophyceae sp. CCMP2097]|nr:P-loop containing nucleoside triphosphate hydrolase protein [Pelagophyceae sp. CCMP2097]
MRASLRVAAWVALLASGSGLAPSAPQRASRVSLAAAAAAPDAPPQDYWPGVNAGLRERLEAAGYARPTLIQTKTLKAYGDVIIHAPTGSGKTLAFLVPALSKMLDEDGGRMLVVVPSLELAVQLGVVARSLWAAQAPLVLISDGVSTLEDHRRLVRERPRVVIGTAKRITEIAGTKARDWDALLRDVDTLVLDEADLLLPPAPKFDDAPDETVRFKLNAAILKRHSQKPIVKLLAEFGKPRTAPAEGAAPRALARTVLCSATADADLASRVCAALGSKKSAGDFRVLAGSTALAPPKALIRRGAGFVRMPGTIKHKAYVVKDGRRELSAMAAATALQSIGPRCPVVIVDDTASVSAAVGALRSHGCATAVALHHALGLVGTAGDAPERNADDFLVAGDRRLGDVLNLRDELQQSIRRGLGDDGSGEPPLVVTTASAARGLDLKGVDCVILLDPPKSVDSYIHIAGRCGREGTKGTVVSILPQDSAEETLLQLKRELGVSFERVILSKINAPPSRKRAPAKKPRAAAPAAKAAPQQSAADAREAQVFSNVNDIANAFLSSKPKRR